MKSRTLTCITAMTLFAALAIPVRLVAQEQQKDKKDRHYKVLDLGTLGGTFSFATGINNKGLVDGFSNLRGDMDTASGIAIARDRKILLPTRLNASEKESKGLHFDTSQLVFRSFFQALKTTCFSCAAVQHS